MNETFESLGLSDRWNDKLKSRGISQPVSIQISAIPPLLKGQSAVIRSQTGTGKTLAYLLPVLELLDPASDQLQAMVLAPTAELAMQIAKEAGDLLEGTGMHALALIGGASLQRQLERLKRRPQLAVGTPGRILELQQLRKLKLADVRRLVVDEADQTFALGAGGEAERVIRALPAADSKQLVFCSATMPAEAESLIKALAPSAEWIGFEAGESSGSRLPSTVKHFAMVTEERERIDTLRKLIRTLNPASAIMFVNDTGSVAEVEAKLRYHGLDVASIYGDQPKQERSAVMQRFRSGKLKLLLATDVAARGLDAERVTHVIHIDPPFGADRYLHRAGRTGRMGRAGTSVLLITPKQKFIADKFARELGITFEEKMLYSGEVVARSEISARKPPSAQTYIAPAAPNRGRPATSGTASASAKEVKRNSNRQRDKKNKGAPRWLKEKREQDKK